MLLLRSLPILCALLLSACGKPPKGPLGILGDAGCVYADEREMPNNVCRGKEIKDGTCILTFAECAKAGSIATTPDYDKALRKAYVDCLTPAVGPMCVVGESAVFCNDQRPMDRNNLCFSKPVMDGTCDLTHQEAVNFVITTASYFRELRDWYRRKCGE